jgi:acetyl esterase/lipase
MPINTWAVEDRAAIIPIFGRILAESFHKTEVEEEEIWYGKHFHQHILLFWPKKKEQLRKTGVVFLHGGGWSSGSPLLFRFVGLFFARLGFPTILGGYRLAPRYHFPTQMRDVRMGLKSGLNFFSQKGITIHNLIAGGHSAGAQLSGLLVFDQTHNRSAGFRKNMFTGYYSISGPINFSVCQQPALRKMIGEFLGKGVNWDIADPIRYVQNGSHLPVMLIHGDRDHLVEIENTLTFAEALKKKSPHDVEVEIVPGAHHADLVGLFVDDQPVRGKFTEWLLRCDSKDSNHGSLVL